MPTRARASAASSPAGALDDVRAHGQKVIAECPFIKGWIAEHEDYQDLLRRLSRRALTPRCG